jgi:hypothetical protein
MFQSRVRLLGQGASVSVAMAAIALIFAIAMNASDVPAPQQMIPVHHVALAAPATPEEAIAFYQRQASDFSAEVTELAGQVSDGQEVLSRARQEYERRLPEYERMQRRLAHLPTEIEQAKADSNIAAAAYSEFERTVRTAKEAAVREFTTAGQQYVDQARQELAAARRQRDELRKRVGALPADQSEVQQASNRDRQLQKRATELCDLAIQQAFAAIDDEAWRRRTAAIEAQAAVTALEQDRARIRSRLDAVARTLVECRDKINAMPSQLAALDARLNEIQQSRTVAELHLSVAQDEFRNKTQALAGDHQPTTTNALYRPERSTGFAPSSASRPSSYYGRSSQSGWSATPSSSAASTSGRYFDFGYRPSVGQHYVSPHLRSDGSYVPGHYKTNADDSFWNNWSSYGNTNPHTGSVGTTLPRASYSSGSTYVRGHYRGSTWVDGHYRNN